MAISEHLRGVEVCVTIDGNDVKEYPDSDSTNTGNATVQYIEAITDKKFAIRMKVDKKFKFAANCLFFHITIDGSSMAAKFCVEADRGQDLVSTGKYVDSVLRNYQFTSVETPCNNSAEQEAVSDGHVLQGEAAQLEDLGNIMVEVYQYKKTQRERASPPKKVKPAPSTGPKRAATKTKATMSESTESESDGGAPDQHKEVSIVSEKAIKEQAISHSVRLAKADIPRVTASPGATGRSSGLTNGGGKPKAKAALRRKTETHYEGLSDKPVATFIFKYRSLAALRSLMIIPRTPTPAPLEERDITTLSIDELRELQKRAKASKDKEAISTRVKREHEEEEPRPRKIARPTATSTQLELDDNGEVLEAATPSAAKSQPEVIELD